MATISVQSDLQFSIDLPAVGKVPTRRISGTLSGQGNVLDLEFDEVPALDRSSSGAALRTWAKRISAAGVQIAVRDRSGLLATVGAVRPSLLGLLLTGSRWVRLGRLGVVIRSQRRRGRPTLSLRDLMPPRFRSEHADHSRPHAGRIGGEAGHQIPQEMPVYRQPRSR